MFYNKRIEQIKEELKTSHHGLTNSQVKERILKYGKNSLPKKKKDSIVL